MKAFRLGSTASLTVLSMVYTVKGLVIDDLDYEMIGLLKGQGSSFLTDV